MCPSSGRRDVRALPNIAEDDRQELQHMLFLNRLNAGLVAVAVLAPSLPIAAKTRKGDNYLGQGRVHEAKKEWDAALDSYERALSEDPAELVYQMATEKARFQAGQIHIESGLKLRAKRQLGEALLEFQKAFAINSSSAIALQEVQLTRDMIERERQRTAATGTESSPAVRALTPIEEYSRNEKAKLNRILSVPELRPLGPGRINLRMNNRTKVLFETLAALAGINVLWDPEFQPPAKDGFNLQLEDVTIEQALDYLAVLTKSYWKPMSSNTIFITMDNPNKRRDYEEWVTKVFYLQNLLTPQELQEVVNAVRTITDMSKVSVCAGQNALVVRGEADKVELAEKIIGDLDKPKSEVVVDVMVIEASSMFSRQLSAALTGLNVPFNFNPRQSVQVQSSSSNSTNSSSTAIGTGTASSGTASTGTVSTGTTTATATSTQGTFVPLNQLGHLSSADFATTLPGALLQAVMSDAKTKVLQAPQVRSLDNAKAILKIGQREPTATGSFQPGIGGVGINPLVNTQFTYIDVGVNVELLPRIHDNGEVTMHIKLDISNVANTVDLGGIQQPVIGQRAVEHDIRMREGEVGLLGGLINTEEDKTITGVPGLDKIPLLRRLFSGESVSHNRDELMIVLVPHIIRRPEVNAENLRSIATGTQLTVKLMHEAPPSETKTGQSLSPAVTQNLPAANTAVASVTQGVAPGAGTNPVAQPANTPPATAPPATGGPAQGPARVYFMPSQVNTDLGRNVTVSLVVDGASNMVSAPLTITWDNKLLQLNDIGAGDLLSKDGQPPIFIKNIQNDEGRAMVLVSALPNNATPNPASGVLIILSFNAVGRGLTNITVSTLTIRDLQDVVLFTGSLQLGVNVR